MAGFKHRYIVVKIDSKANNAVASNLRSLLYKNIKHNFGDFVLSTIDCFEILETHENLGIVIIRCNLSFYKYLTYSIVSLGSFNDIKVRFSILATSGILRRAKIKLLKIIENSHETKVKAST